MSDINKNIGNITSKITEHGAPVIERLLNTLTGKGALVRYSFEDLKIEMPSATDPNGRTIRGGKMTIHGTITISAKMHDLNDTSGGSAGSAAAASTSSNSQDYDKTLRATNKSLADSVKKDQLKTSDDEPALRDYNSSDNAIST
ncbi:MAG TPA: hypothetical protein VLE21_00520 [Candidatus Nitrosocosmicus sp.]|nr:hypothetical protein [Candidatus Nitrosocosmicus sp.]